MTNKKHIGRPFIYNTADELRAAVDAYFESCKARPVFDADGKPIFDAKGRPVMTPETPLTMSGLALALGYSDQRVFTRQRARGPEFAEIVLRAKLVIEDFNVRKTYDKDGFWGAAHVLRTYYGWGSGEIDTQGPPTVNVIIQEPEPEKEPAAGAEPAPAAGQIPAHRANIELLN